MRIYIEWIDPSPYEAFIDNIIKAKEKSRTATETVTFVSLEIGKIFLENYNALAQEERDLVSQAFISAPITQIDFCVGLDSIRFARSLAFRQLCNILRAIPTIKLALLKFRNREEVNACARLLQNLRNLNELQIRSYEPNLRNTWSSALANSLTRHPTLQRLDVLTPASFWPAISTAVRTIRSLKWIRFIKVFRGGRDFELGSTNGAGGLCDMERIAEMIPLRSSNVELVLQRFDLTPEDESQCLCNMIISGQLKGIAFEHCRLCESPVFFDTLASSRLESFRFLYFDFDHQMTQASSFMQSLGRALARMSKLRAMECAERDSEALASMIRQVAGSSSLRSLKVSHASFPPVLDQSLSNCVQHQNAIVDYTLRTWQRYANVQGEQVRTQYALPTFLEALTTNYTVLKVAFECANLGEPWDPAWKANVEALIRLNVAGRGRVAMDPTNKRNSINVLDQVREDMDCIFIHLCENPLICGGLPRPARRQST